jgi:hypothetical protein
MKVTQEMLLIQPSLDWADKHGLPSYPEPLEKLVDALMLLDCDKLTAEEEQILESWLKARMATIQERQPKDQQARQFIAGIQGDE